MAQKQRSEGEGALIKTLKVSLARQSHLWQGRPARKSASLIGEPLGSFLVAAGLLALAGLACNFGVPSQSPTAVLPDTPPLPTSGAQPAPTALASMTLEPTLTLPAPTEPFQPTEAKLQSGQAAGLLAELYFGGGGAGDEGCTGAVAPPEQDWPAMLDLGRLERAPDGISAYPDYDFGTLCLYGYLPGEPISLAALSPEGGEFTGQKQVGETLSVTPDGVPFVEIGLRLPVGLPQGTWSFAASSASVQVEGSFEVTPFRYPETSLVEEPEVNPFGSDFAASHFHGEAITVLGDGFPPDAQVPVGVYRQTDRSNAEGDQVAELVASALLQSGPDGRMEIAWQTEANDPPSVDCLIAVVYPEAQHMYLAGPVLCVPLK